MPEKHALILCVSRFSHTSLIFSHFSFVLNFECDCLDSVNLDEKYLLEKKKKVKNVCEMMNRSCLSINVEQVREDGESLLTRRYFPPLRNMPRDFENGHFPV